MIVIIAGSRNIKDPKLIDEAVRESGFELETVVSGGARGVDSMAEDWAYENNKAITVLKADWERYGNSAGFRRNIDMANTADALIAIWDGSSAGTRNMINIAKEKGLRVHIKIVS